MVASVIDGTQRCDQHHRKKTGKLKTFDFGFEFTLCVFLPNINLE